MKELTITAPQGYEIDKENSTFEKIVFKEVCKYPEYPTYLTSDNSWLKCVRQELLGGNYSNGMPYLANGFFFSSVNNDRNEEIVSFIKLLAFRDAVWAIDNWKPDWTERIRNKYVISMYCGVLSYTYTESGNNILAFKTAETRDWFYNTHKDLIEKAKNLL
jgi:hypothetical protein